VKRESPSALTDLECACATARQFSRVITQLYDGRMRETGLEAAQFALLMTLHKEGPTTQADLGRRYAVDKTTVSRNLKLLELKGWIESTTAADRRVRQFVLTTEGRRLLHGAKLEWKTAQNELLAAIGNKEWDAMFRVLRTVTRTAQTLQEKKR
jgi:DNA-binding MarR family transcriptional regulator